MENICSRRLVVFPSSAGFLVTLTEQVILSGCSSYIENKCINSDEKFRKNIGGSTLTRFGQKRTYEEFVQFQYSEITVHVTKCECTGILPLPHLFKRGEHEASRTVVIEKVHILHNVHNVTFENIIIGRYCCRGWR